MANVNKSFRWNKNGFSYKLDGNFTNEQRGYFQKACDKWAPHCGLRFTPVQTNPDILASWGKVERDAAGQFVAGVTNRGNPATITFNTDVTSWTKYTKLSSDTNADFFNTCVHEIGHAIGMMHSNNENAQMFFSGQLSGAGNWELNDDDIGGVRYLYKQPPYYPNPGLDTAPKYILLVNETPIPLDYSWYKTGDTIMTSPLMDDWRPAKGTLKDFYEILVWKEVQDIFNSSRKYRLKVEGVGLSLIRDDIPPLAQVGIFDAGGRLDAYVYAGNWGFNKDNYAARLAKGEENFLAQARNLYGAAR